MTYKRVTHSKAHKNPKTCAGYVNYWCKKHHIPQPNKGIKPIKPPPSMLKNKVNLIDTFFEVLSTFHFF